MYTDDQPAVPLKADSYEVAFYIFVLSAFAAILAMLARLVWFTL